MMVMDCLAGVGPRVFWSKTTSISSAIVATGFWTACGENSRGSNPVGMRLYDILMHTSSTDSAQPGRTVITSVVGSTANVASTTLSSGFNASYDVTVAVSTY
jgi:hypothetical protein